MEEDTDEPVGFLSHTDSDEETPEKPAEKKSVMGRHRRYNGDFAPPLPGVYRGDFYEPPTRARVEKISENARNIDKDAPLDERIDQMMEGLERVKPAARPLNLDKAEAEDGANYIGIYKDRLAANKKRLHFIEVEIKKVEDELEENHNWYYRAQDTSSAMHDYGERASDATEVRITHLTKEYMNNPGKIYERFNEEISVGEFISCDDEFDRLYETWREYDFEYEKARIGFADEEFQRALRTYRLAYLHAEKRYVSAVISAGSKNIEEMGDEDQPPSEPAPLVPAETLAAFALHRQVLIKQAGFELLREITGWSYNKMATTAQVAQSAVTRFMKQSIAPLFVENNPVDFKDNTLNRIVDSLMETMRTEIPKQAHQYINETDWTNFCSIQLGDNELYIDPEEAGRSYPHQSPKGPQGYLEPKSHVNYILHRLKLSARAVAIIAPTSNIGRMLQGSIAYLSGLNIDRSDLHVRVDATTALIDEKRGASNQLNETISKTGVEPVTFTETEGLFPVVGYVQAGEWRAAVEELPEFVSYPGVGADEAEFGLRVRGDSMDKRFPEGSILYCNRYNEEDDKLPIGEYVIVMRQDKASDEVEATCKRLEKHDSLPNVYVLQPESSNRNHTRMLLENTGDEKVWIHAVVVGAFIKF